MSKLTNVDYKYLGTEPKKFSQVLTLDSVELSKCFNWYNHFHDKADAKKWCIAYAKIENKELSKKLSNVPESNFRIAYGAIARLHTNGVQLDAKVIERLNEFLHYICAFEEQVNQEEAATKEAANVVSIQQKVAAKAESIIGEMEEIFDEQHALIKSGKPTTFSCYNYLTKNQIKKQYCAKIIDFYTKRLDEVNEAIEGKDEQLTEAFAYLPKKKIKKLAEHFEAILADASRYSANNSATRKPRKKKEKPVTKVVEAVKYLKQFKELQITSIDPTQIVGAQQLWIYNVKYKKLTRFDAIGPAGLSIKGTTVINFDEKLSKSKSLRKPKESIDKVLTGGKIVLRKLLDDLKTKEQTVTGRINNDVVLLRSIK